MSVHGELSVRLCAARSIAATGLVAAVLVVAPGCEHSSPPSEPSDTLTTTLAVGQRAVIAVGVLVSFDRVVSDSRCPVGVACVWEGETTVALTLKQPAGTEAFTLSDHAPKREVGGHSFTLLSVAPVPTAGSTIPEDAYRVTLRVAGAI